MIRIQITAPFRYEYQGKRVWLTTGESMYLNTNDADQRGELKYILSSKFPYKQYVYINLDSVDTDLKLEIGQDEGFYKVEDPYPYPLPEEVCPVVPKSFMEPYEEPTDNPHLNPVISAVLSSINATHPNQVEPVVVTDDLCEGVTSEVDEDDRRKELSLTNWSKVKDIANTYGIEYTNKAEVIEQIILIEFNEPI